MNGLTIFGLVAVTAMLVCYALEKRSHWFVMAFAGSCVLASAYGFLQGAWPKRCGLSWPFGVGDLNGAFPASEQFPELHQSPVFANLTAWSVYRALSWVQRSIAFWSRAI